MGSALLAQGNLDECISMLRRALELKADLAEAHGLLGNALREQALHDEALACYKRAIQHKPDEQALIDNMLYSLHFNPSFDARAIFEEHWRWGVTKAEYQRGTPHANDRSPDRPLRIGYVSPDLTFHPVGRFMLPLLEAHDRANFKVYCYSAAHRPNIMTDRCRAQADVWRD